MVDPYLFIVNITNMQYAKVYPPTNTGTPMLDQAWLTNNEQTHGLA